MVEHVDDLRIHEKLEDVAHLVMQLDFELRSLKGDLSRVARAYPSENLGTARPGLLDILKASIEVFERDQCRRKMCLALLRIRYATVIGKDVARRVESLGGKVSEIARALQSVKRGTNQEIEDLAGQKYSVSGFQESAKRGNKADLLLEKTKLERKIESPVSELVKKQQLDGEIGSVDLIGTTGAAEKLKEDLKKDLEDLKKVWMDLEEDLKQEESALNQTGTNVYRDDIADHLVNKWMEDLLFMMIREAKELKIHLEDPMDRVIDPQMIYSVIVRNISRFNDAERAVKRALQTRNNRVTLALMREAELHQREREMVRMMLKELNMEGGSSKGVQSSEAKMKD